jgi:hypothetical protein
VAQLLHTVRVKTATIPSIRVAPDFRAEVEAVPAEGETLLDRRFDFLLERELSREGGQPSLPTQAIAALHSGIATLKTSPFTCRKAGQSPFLRVVRTATTDARPCLCQGRAGEPVIPSSGA